MSISRWREKYKVHPAADVFPMMSDDELAAMGEDIRKNGLREPVDFWMVDPIRWCDSNPGQLIDGRNRLEAMERAGVECKPDRHARFQGGKNPASYIISKNIHRRHLTKQQQADLIVAAVKAGQKPTQVESVSKGGRGKVNPVKQQAIEEGEKAGISKGTVERSFANASGKKPKKPKPKPKHFDIRPDIEDAEIVEEEEGESEAYDTDEDFRRRAFLLRAQESWMAAKHNGFTAHILTKCGQEMTERDLAPDSEITIEIIRAAMDAGNAWIELAEELQKRKLKHDDKAA